VLVAICLLVLHLAPTYLFYDDGIENAVSVRATSPPSEIIDLLASGYRGKVVKMSE